MPTINMAKLGMDPIADIAEYSHKIRNRIVFIYTSKIIPKVLKCLIYMKMMMNNQNLGVLHVRCKCFSMFFFNYLYKITYLD